MHKPYQTLLILALCLFSSTTIAQNHVEKFLQSVEASNFQLDAARKRMEADQIRAFTGLTPENPTISCGYMPGSTDAMGTKTVYGVSQSVDFPGSYIANKKAAEQEAHLSALQYRIFRQNVLLQAQTAYLEYIYMLKMTEATQQRFDHVQQWLSYYEARYEKGDASVMDYNKAKIQFLGIEAKLLLLKQDLANQYDQLVLLNGGKEVDVQAHYADVKSTSLDSILALYQQQSPEMQQLAEQRRMAELRVRVQKQNVLPDFEVGYEAENSEEGNYRGIKAGMSVPLWQDKNKVKLANLEAEFVESNAIATEKLLQNEVRRTYNTSEKLRKMLKEYELTMDRHINVEYLDKALKLGELSVIDYFTELSFYYETEDAYLQIEKEYHLQYAKLNSFLL